MSLKNALILNSNFNEIYSEIGGLLYLFEQGYVPDVIIASSFSSITGALLAKEPSIKGIREIIDFYKFLKRQDFLNENFLKKILTIKSFYSTKSLEYKLRKVLPQSFKLLKIPLYILAYNVDKDSIKVFNKEGDDNLISAIMSSLSIPGVYRPYILNGQSYISSVFYPSYVLEFALEIGVNNVNYFIGDYRKISEIVPKDYKLLLIQNYKEFLEETSRSTSRILIYNTSLDRNLFDFSDSKKLIDRGYQETRKKYIYYRLFRFGRIKEALDLLKRPDLSDEERIMKAYATYLEGDISQAYIQFSELHNNFPDNILVINGYTNTLIDIGEIEQAGEVLENYKNRTDDPYFFDTFSRYYFYRGEIDKALECLKIAMNYSKNDQIAYNLALVHYGIIMHSIGNSKEALDSFIRACDNLKNLDNAYYLSFAYTNFLNFYLQSQEFQKIEILKTEIEELLELSGSSRTKFIFYLNYSVFLQKYNMELSLKYRKKALDIAIDKGSTNLLVLSLLSISDAYVMSKEFQKAELYANEAFKIAKENNLTSYIVLSLKNLIQIKAILGKLEEALELLSLIDERDIPPIYQVAFDMIKLFIFGKKEDTEVVNRIIQNLKARIHEFVFAVREVFDIVAIEVENRIIPHLSINDLLLISKDIKPMLKRKLETEPKAKLDFLENLNLEDSINYIDEIRSFSGDPRFKIYIGRFTEHWRKVCEQYITLFGEIMYFFNNDIRPLSVFGDDFNLLILIYLIVNKNKILTYGNISIAFGIHSENIKLRLRHILDVIEPWSIVQTPKYLIVEEDKILFKTDENFKVDLHLFQEYLEKGSLEAAINIYRGDFVPNITHPFFVNLRNEIKLKYLNVVYELAQKYISDKAYDRAIFVLESLLNRDILNLEHLKFLISILYKIGKRAYAYEWYLRYLSIVEEPKFKFEEAIV